MEKVKAVAQHYNTWKEYAYFCVEAELLLNNGTWNVSTGDSMGGYVKPQDICSEAQPMDETRRVITPSTIQKNRHCAAALQL